MPMRYTPRYARIDLGDDDYIEVRGFSVSDIENLLEVHLKSLSDMFDQFTGEKATDFDMSNFQSIAQAVVVGVPGLASHALALASDDLENMEAYDRLPMDVLIAALTLALEQTFKHSGGLGNFLEKTLVPILRKMTGGLEDLRSRNGTGQRFPSSSPASGAGSTGSEAVRPTSYPRTSQTPTTTP